MLLQVPVMDINGVRHGQSRALLRWAGARSGLYPMHQDAGGEILQLHIDAALDTITDIQSSLTPAWYGHACSRSPLNKDLLFSLPTYGRLLLGHKAHGSTDDGCIRGT